MRPKYEVIYFTIAFVAISFDNAFAICKPQVYGTGNSNISMSAAEAAARLAWSTNAKNWHGLQFASWSKAVNKSSSCKKTGSKRTCTYYAKPCN